MSSGSPRKMSFETDPPELIAYEVDPWDSSDRDKKGKKGKKSKKGKKGRFDSPVDEVENPVAVDWPKDKQGRMVLDTRKGKEMIAVIADLYKHLRNSSAKDSSVRDSYGLWMHLDDSEDEGGGSDENEEREDGDVTFDTSVVQRQQDAKKLKHALRVDNPDHMKPEEIVEALKKRGLSTKGDAQKQKETFEAWLIKEALRMAAVSPYVVHFNSDRTQRNLEMLVAKVNQLRHGQVQEKLKAAHADIRRLEKLHDVVAKQQGTILERDATIRALQARVAELEAVSGGLGGGGGSRGTIAAFTKDARFGGSGARPAPWTLSEIADNKAMAQTCIVLVIDSTSGFEWSQQFRAKRAKTKDGRQCSVIHTAWHLINVSSTSHFGGCAVVDVLLGSTGVTRVIPDVVLVRDPCKSVHGEDHTHQLHALLHSGTPCINSAAALLACSDRPNVYAALLAIRNKQGMNKRGEFNFPLVQQEFFANEAPNGIAPSFPVVAKLSSVHAGFGKFRCADAHLFNELVCTWQLSSLSMPTHRKTHCATVFGHSLHVAASQTSVVAVSTDYYTTEEHIQGATAEIYVLRLGKTVRCYRKTRNVHFRTWNEWGDAPHFEDIPTTTEYKNWSNWVSEMFGGLDIFAIDILQLQGQGKKPIEYIIGIHDTGCALVDQHANEDAAALIELVLKRVDERRKELKSYVGFP